VGYHNQLKGKWISVVILVLRIADVFDTLISNRQNSLCWLTGSSSGWRKSQLPLAKAMGLWSEVDQGKRYGACYVVVIRLLLGF
jgi:hypothetical protein